MVRPEGVEPPTTEVEARGSIQLSYGRMSRDVHWRKLPVNDPTVKPTGLEKGNDALNGRPGMKPGGVTVALRQGGGGWSRDWSR